MKNLITIISVLLLVSACDARQDRAAESGPGDNRNLAQEGTDQQDPRANINPDAFNEDDMSPEADDELAAGSPADRQVPGRDQAGANSRDQAGTNP